MKINLKKKSTKKGVLNLIGFVIDGVSLGWSSRVLSGLFNTSLTLFHKKKRVNIQEIE
jgi:hypothetical protein